MSLTVPKTPLASKLKQQGSRVRVLAEGDADIEMPIAYCLLPIAYYLSPIASCTIASLSLSKYIYMCISRKYKSNAQAFAALGCTCLRIWSLKPG